MRLGIFARTFLGTDFEAGFAAAKHYGLECIQFNFSCAGLATLPEMLEPALLDRIRSGLSRQSLSLAAVSGTCNLIHPQAAQRADNLNRLETLIGACGRLGTSIVTLCTGTRDPSDMWRAHPENHQPQAWRDLVESLERLLPLAEKHQVFLGLEPEPANVIDSALRARRLLDDLKSPALKIIFDAANLLTPQTLEQQSTILREGVDLLGHQIVLAHAKDLSGGAQGKAVAAGQGALDFGGYVALLREAGFNGPLILHQLSEKEVPAAVAFLKTKLCET